MPYLAEPLIRHSFTRVRVYLAHIELLALEPVYMPTTRLAITFLWGRNNTTEM